VRVGTEVPVAVVVVGDLRQLLAREVWLIYGFAGLADLLFIQECAGDARQRRLLEQLAEVENKDLESKGLVDKVRDIFG